MGGMTEPASPATTTAIEVIADLSCPFAHAGLHRWLARREASGRKDVSLRVRAWPLELVNGTPLTGSGIAAKVAALSVAFPELFAGFEPDNFPATTLPALQMSNAAARVDPATGERVAIRLRDLIFIEGENIADPGVLDRVAAEFGVPSPDAIDEQAVLDDLAEGRSRGVIGSPHYFGPGFDDFCPGLDIAHVGDALDVTRAGSRFDEFVDRCFSLER